MFIKVDTNLNRQDPEPISFKELGQKLKNTPFTEKDLEEFVRRNIDALFEDEETLLIIGQQVTNKAGGRNDLVAVDAEGSLVLLEEKRDPTDIAQRAEPFEFQAIRYAASLALIRTVDEAVEKLFGPYIKKHLEEFTSQLNELTAEELARRLLNDFLADNNATPSFNQTQRIALIASAFDNQTLSACAWLAHNGVDIQCIQIQPYALGGHIRRLIPPPRLDEFFIEIEESHSAKEKSGGDKQIKRAYLPRMDKLFEWGILKEGDQLSILKRENSQATVKDEKRVVFNGQEMTFNEWGQMVTGWSSICIYDWAVSEKHGHKTLDQLRRERMEAEQKATA